MVVVAPRLEDDLLRRFTELRLPFVLLVLEPDDFLSNTVAEFLPPLTVRPGGRLRCRLLYPRLLQLISRSCFFLSFVCPGLEHGSRCRDTVLPGPFKHFSVSVRGPSFKRESSAFKAFSVSSSSPSVSSYSFALIAV